MEIDHNYRQSEYSPHLDNHSVALFSNKVLDQAVSILESALPDWESIASSFTTDRRHKNNIDNMTGALAEHTAREGLAQYLCSLAHDNTGAYVYTNPLPESAAQVGKYMFLTDVYSGNCVVMNPYTNQAHTEYDGVFAVETPKRNGKKETLIVVLESKLSIPRLPKRKGFKHVKRYVERKLKPLRALFNTHKFAFIMTVCRAKKITRNQMRFIRALKKLGGKIAMLGVHRDELKALALSYV